MIATAQVIKIRVDMARFLQMKRPGIDPDEFNAGPSDQSRS
jgi:hypothetical protein